ncbi:MAG: hypothetical protein Q8K67_05080 [Geothrix sp.]|nr:hypothetical protein [Geothrix sp.]
MRRTTLFTALLALAVAPAAQATMPMVKKAKDLGITQIENCKSCHAEKNTKDSLNEAGKWMIEQKAARKAAECDVAWMKEYYAKKK